MTTSRRKFLKTGTVVALTAGVPLSASANSLINGASLFGVAPRGSGLDMATFRRVLRTNFQLSSSTNSTTVKLAEVRDRRTGRMNKTAKECFSLIFLGPEKGALKQDTYVARHEALGEFSMLVVPVGGNNYEAIFNRL